MVSANVSATNRGIRSAGARERLSVEEEMAVKEQMMMVRILLVRIQNSKLMRRKVKSWVRTKRMEHLRVGLVMKM